jgi:uncharacterized protein
MLVIAVVAFVASLLTLISGFGLGTLLTPVFGLFFPIHVAIALTGVVHLLNNLFKLALLGRQADRSMVVRFGVPSVVGGLVGAWLLATLTRWPVWHTWHFFSKKCDITPLKLLIAVVMVWFALMELVPRLRDLRFGVRYLTLGGLLSGFFGGLSGNQGALRSAFLLQAGLPKEVFVATGVVVACLVDLTRLPVYASRFAASEVLAQWPLLLVATLSAFAGAWLGTRFLKKMTLQNVQYTTAAFILVFAVLLGTGVM